MIKRLSDRAIERLGEKRKNESGSRLCRLPLNRSVAYRQSLNRSIALSRSVSSGATKIVPHATLEESESVIAEQECRLSGLD